MPKPRSLEGVFFLLCSCASSLALSMPLSPPPAFVRLSPPPTLGCPPKSHRCGSAEGRLFLSSNDDGNDASHRGRGRDGASTEPSERTISQSPSPSIKTRRQFFQQQILASTSFVPSVAQASGNEDSGYVSLRNKYYNVPPYSKKQQLAKQRKLQEQERDDRRKRAMSIAKPKKWTPFVNVKKWNSAETCLLEMLPVRNPVFRKLQELIEGMEAPPPADAEAWREILLDLVAILSFLNSKRSMLEPVFNQEDPTELYISKSSLGESNIEALRSRLEDLITIARGRDIDVGVDDGGGLALGIDMEKSVDIDVDAFIEGRRQALMTLSELGELLVPSFPYAVPNRGKFGYLPRLLGRCSVTLSFERPSSPSPPVGLGEAFGINFGGIGGIGGIGGKDNKFLGNVTIVADGYAAPITAGNFVDLSFRQFYTGLSVKAMRKRLGVVPTWNDNVVLNDLTGLKDNLVDSAMELDGERGVRGMFFRNQNGVDTVLPILGSFQEGFYDPLTAKPRRIPLEVLTLDDTSPTKSTLTYSSTYGNLDDDVANAGTTKYSALASSSSAQRSFSSSTSSTSSNSTASTYSNLDPVLSFNIPGLVALNHPDRITNGGSAEFFALPRGDPKQAKVLDGQYAPFGYIVSGSNVYQSLRPGDVIGATYVSEVGLLNLVKIRKNAFEGVGKDEEEKNED